MTKTDALALRYVGGPTLPIDIGGFTILTDPTFDENGTEYTTSLYTLRKTGGPRIPVGELNDVDVVLLSHDHHFDNLDNAGRKVLEKAKTVITTVAGATRLGRNAVGIRPWERLALTPKNGRRLLIDGTPARHGPEGGDRGPVTGFVLTFEDEPSPTLYVSGDTVWFDGIREIGQRYLVDVAVLFMGAARVPEVGPHHLTMTAREALLVADCFPNAMIVPVHFEDWAHFTESRADIQRTFDAAGKRNRLRWPDA